MNKSLYNLPNSEKYRHFAFENLDGTLKIRQNIRQSLNLQDLLRSVDAFSYSVGLTYNGSQEYSTAIGGSFTVLLLILVCVTMWESRLESVSMLCNPVEEEITSG